MSTKPTPWVVRVDARTVEAHQVAKQLGITPHQARVKLDELDAMQAEAEEHMFL